jgi:hypothetical protein
MGEGGQLAKAGWPEEEEQREEGSVGGGLKLSISLMYRPA